MQYFSQIQKHNHHLATNLEESYRNFQAFSIKWDALVSGNCSCHC